MIWIQPRRLTICDFSLRRFHHGGIAHFIFTFLSFGVCDVHLCILHVNVTHMCHWAHMLVRGQSQGLAFTVFLIWQCLQLHVLCTTGYLVKNACGLSCFHDFPSSLQELRGYRWSTLKPALCEFWGSGIQFLLHLGQAQRPIYPFS